MEMVFFVNQFDFILGGDDEKMIIDTEIQKINLSEFSCIDFIPTKIQEINNKNKINFEKNNGPIVIKSYDLSLSPYVQISNKKNYIR